MTKDDIIRMAREAGLWLFNDSEGHCDGITDVELITAEKDRDDDRLAEILMPFANLVAATERAACAEVCELMYDYGWLDAKRCARKIRARGEV